MEEITLSHSYFESKFNMLTGLTGFNGSWQEISNSLHVNIHDKRTHSPQKIWSLWPSPIKEYFLKIINNYPELINRYKEYEYWLPI